MASPGVNRLATVKLEPGEWINKQQNGTPHR